DGSVWVSYPAPYDDPGIAPRLNENSDFHPGMENARGQPDHALLRLPGRQNLKPRGRAWQTRSHHKITTCPLRIIRDRVKPVARPAKSTMPPKAEVCVLAPKSSCP